MRRERERKRKRERQKDRETEKGGREVPTQPNTKREASNQLKQNESEKERNGRERETPQRQNARTNSVGLFKYPIHSGVSTNVNTNTTVEEQTDCAFLRNPFLQHS